MFALSVLGAIMISQPGVASEYGADYDAAFSAMLASPTDLNITFDYAETALSVGDYEGAIGALERMLIYNPDLPRIHVELARLYARLGSAEVAERYYNSALSYNPPYDIRNIIEGEIAALRAADNPSQFTGSFFGGLRYQSNANAGPSSSRIRLGGGNATLSDQFLKDEDGSVILAGSLTHRYDLGWDPTVVMVTRANSYLSRQFDLNQIDTLVLGVTTGPELALNDIDYIGWGRPYLQGQLVTLQNQVYYGAYGAGLEFGGIYDERTSDSWTLNFGVLYKEFESSNAFPTLDDRDGINLHGDGEVHYTFDKATRLSLYGQAQYQGADEDFEAYVDAGVTARLVHGFENPLEAFDTGPWYASASAGLNIRRYDDPDPVIDPNKHRKDVDYTLSLGLAVPIADGLTAVLEGRQQWRQSSIRNFEFNDTSVLTGLSYRF